MSSEKTAIIIGAGVGGLAVANVLAKAGFVVTVYEKNDMLGGRMGQLKKSGYTFDTGPSWYLMKDVFTSYFKLFNKKTDEYYKILRLDPSYKVFFESTNPVNIQSDLAKNLETFESLEVGAADALKDYISLAEKNYSFALKYFLYNPFRKTAS